MKAIPGVPPSVLAGVDDATGMKVGVVVKLAVGGGGVVVVGAAACGRGLSEVGARDADVGVAYCPHSDGVDAQPLSSNEATKIGESTRLTENRRRNYTCGDSRKDQDGLVI